MLAKSFYKDEYLHISFSNLLKFRVELWVPKRGLTQNMFLSNYKDKSEKVSPSKSLSKKRKPGG